MHAHDWIINNLDYEQNITNNNVYNLYGALIEKSAVCEGYAETLKYILDEVDIPCVLVSGTATNSEGKTERLSYYSPGRAGCTDFKSRRNQKVSVSSFGWKYD